MTSRYLLLVLFVCTVDVSAIPQQIQIYSWTENNGSIHYSQFPPQGNIDSSKIIMEQSKVPISSTKKEEKSKDWMADMQKYIEERRSIKETKAAQIKMIKANKNSCIAARKSLELYQSGKRIRRQYDEGKSFRVLSEDERTNSIQRAEKDIKSYC